MRHEIVRAAPPREPYFEPPPRLVASPERRLTARAAAAMANHGTHGFRDNALSLVAAGDGAAVVSAAGAAVTAVFGTMCGRLRGPPGSLAEVVAAAFDEARASDAVTPFEAAVATPSAACVLMRGIMLPTTDGAEAVISWKQVLDADATARIRAELLTEMRRPVVRRAPIDAFA